MPKTLSVLAARLRARIIPLQPRYPQSDPTLLLYTILRRRLRPGLLPPDVGAILIDAPAAVAIGQFILHGRAMSHLPLAIRDRSGNRSRYLIAPIGTSLADLLHAAGIDPRQAKLRAGPLLRQLTVPPDAVLGCAELVLHAMAPAPTVIPAPCIRCAACIDHCPMRIDPAALLEAAQRSDRELARIAGLAACIECGACGYVCPSQLPLLPAIRTLRTP